MLNTKLDKDYFGQAFRLLQWCSVLLGCDVVSLGIWLLTF